MFIIHNGPISTTYEEHAIFWHNWLDVLKTMEIDRKVLGKPYPELWLETRKEGK